MKVKSLKLKIKNYSLKLKVFGFLFITLNFASLTFNFSKAQAQTSVSLTAIPPRLELKAKPGETLQETIKVRNDSDIELVIQSQVKDFIVIDNKGTPKPVEEEVSGRWSLASWIYLSPEKTVLKPKTTQVISLVISIPKDALPGGHYAMISHTPLTEALIGGGATGPAIAQKVGTLVYLTVEGLVAEDANLIRFEANKSFAEYGPIKLVSEIQNLSDIHIRPTGKITIYNTLNKVAASLPLKEVNIFPFKSRVYENEFGGKWHFGRYKAVLEAAYGTRGKVLTGLIYFWIIPWKIVSAIVFALVGVLLLIWIIHRKTRKKEKEKV